MGKDVTTQKEIGRIASKAMRKPKALKKREIRALGASTLAQMTERARAAAKRRRKVKADR